MGCNSLIIGLIIMLIGSIFIGPFAIFLVPLNVLLFWVFVGAISSIFRVEKRSNESMSSLKDEYLERKEYLEDHRDDVYDVYYDQLLDKYDDSDISDYIDVDLEPREHYEYNEYEEYYEYEEYDEYDEYGEYNDSYLDYDYDNGHYYHDDTDALDYPDEYLDDD